MKNIETVTREQLEQIVSNSKKTFDIVRLVDPDHTAIISFEDKDIIRTEMEPCFKIWNKNERCENCVSSGACKQQHRMTKFEYKDNEMFSVIAMPFLVKDGMHEYMLAMELVNYVSDDITVQVRGHQSGSNATELINYKIYKDSSTGAYNRRYYDEKMYIEKMRIQNYDKLGFIVVDVNRFKHVNDYYGHANGDDLLFHVGKALMATVRGTDSVIRIGGDEFFIVMMNCNKIVVEKKMQALKNAVESIRLDWLGDAKPSISTGMSYTDKYDGTDEQLENMFAEADRMMYDNKSMPVESKKSMLVIDDIEMNRKMLKAFFETDFDIYEAEDGLEGLKVLHDKVIEIVITDINMPNMNGLEMIRQIRKDSEVNKMIIFAITERGEKWELESLEAGADDFINKPFSMELLNHRIKGVLSQNTVFNRISQYQLSFNQNQIPFATVKLEENQIQYEYVNDAFAQIMNATPEDFVSGRRKISFHGFLDLIRDVSFSHQRRQLHIYDDITQKYYDLIAYAQDNGFCSFILLRNDAVRELRDSHSEIDQYLLRMSKALVGAVNVYTEINLKTMRYRQINMHDAEYFNVDSEGEYAPAFEYMCQYEIHPDDVDGVRQMLSPKNIKEIGNDDNGVNELRVRYRLKNSTPVKLMESKALFVREPNQRYAVIIAEEITEETVLYEKHTWISSIYEHIAVGVIVSRYDGRKVQTIAINPAACKLLGVTAPEFIAEDEQSLKEITHPDDVEQSSTARKALLSAGRTVELECRVFNRKKKAYFWSSEKSTSVLQADGTILFYMCFYDITERKKLQELRNFMEAEKLAAEQRSSFMSNMSHEIRTPMNAILGLTRLASDIVQEIPEASEYLRQIEDSSEYLLGVINDILDMSKITSGKMELHRDWVLQKDVILPVIQMIEPRMREKGIHFEYNHELMKLNKFEAYLDKQKVKQVLMNLLNNACKFTKTGGTVTIKGESLSVDRENHKALICFIVSDTGCGMSEEFQSRIFIPFSQERTETNFDVPGTGLGLAVSHSIVSAFGGEISVQSKPSEGSTFIVSIPIQYRRANHAEKAEQKNQEYSFGSLLGKRVLLAEDHPLNAVIAIKLLEKAGMIVTYVRNGEEAVRTFVREKGSTFDAILMDIRMPIMDGITATKGIRNLDKPDAKTVPIIAMTANAYDEDRRKSLDAGMNEHLAKPINPDELYITLGKFISRKTKDV